MNNEEFNKRRLEANEKLMEAIDMIDLTDEDAAEKLNAISQLYHELNQDIKNNLDHEDKKAENAIKESAVKAEKEKAAEANKTEKIKAASGILGQVLIAAASVFAACSQLWMFKRSTEKEADEALLTQTDQTVVRNGLSGRFFK